MKRYDLYSWEDIVEEEVIDGEWVRADEALDLWNALDAIMSHSQSEHLPWLLKRAAEKALGKPYA